MLKKTILFLTHYFPPEVNAPANRTFEHCRKWVDKANIIVLTNFPNHPKGIIFEGYKNKLHQKENIEGIEVHRIFTYPAANAGYLFRIINYVFFMIGSLFFVTFSRIKFDKVIATSPQFFCGLAGKYISKIKRKPFYLEIRDIWPESIITVGAIKNKTVIKFLERVELNLYHSAEKIISVTKSFKDNLIRRGISAEKIEIFYNGISRDIFENSSEISDDNLRDFLSKGFKIGYIGTIGMAHSVETLVFAAEELVDTEVRFIIVGSGARDQYVKDLIREKGLKNIELYPLQPRDQIPAIIDRLDIFLVHLKKKPLFKTVIPSKIFEGMIMKKPILIGVEGESLDILMNAKCAIPFEPENYDDLTSKIMNVKGDNKALSDLGKNGYDYVLEHFDRSIIAQKYLEFVLEN